MEKTLNYMFTSWPRYNIFYLVKDFQLSQK